MRKRVSIDREMRRSERRRQPERRRITAAQPVAAQKQVRVPSRREQSIQFATRYLFCLLGLLFFNVAFPETPRVLSHQTINLAFLAYACSNSALFLHALARPAAPLRYRLAMWIDLGMVSMCLAADPNEIPPSAVVYIMVVLGNGMRYGMRVFAEALLVSFFGASVALGLRYVPAADLHPGVLFLALFGGIILVYAYILMARVEATRRRLEDGSYRDALTGLLNRRGLQLVAEQLFADAQQNGRQFAVLFADMDNFKQVNDQYGHLEGDRVLRQVSHTLKMSLRESDIAGRYGGDEFIVILPQTTPQEAVGVAHRVQSRIAGWAEDNALRCSLSVGIGEAPTDGNCLETIMRRVDQAMYANKRAGGGVRLAGAAQPTTPDSA